MKRRKRMGMHKTSTIPSRDSSEVPAHVQAVDATPAAQAHEPLQPGFESTPEKFVAFVNRMAEARVTVLK